VAIKRNRSGTEAGGNGRGSVKETWGRRRQVPRWDDVVEWKGRPWYLVAVQQCPTTVHVSQDGWLPGVKIPPESWKSARWEAGSQRWVVPPQDRSSTAPPAPLRPERRK
jgi:hypothetical protein